MLLFSSFVATSAQAATKYVRAGATGDASGSDWTNAYPALPATLTRGDTYYIANGTYGSYTFDDPTSGTTLITIKKATAADHGTEVGWSSAFGDGQAIFDSISFTTSYWLFDGQTGGGPDQWTSGFGFRIQSTAEALVSISNPAPNMVVSNITVRHFEAIGTGLANFTVGVSVERAADVTVSYCRVHDVQNSPFNAIDRVTNLIIEYCFSGLFYGTAANHAELVSAWNQVSNITFRYNVFAHAASTGGIMCECNGLYVYGNVFYRGATAWVHNNGLIGTWTASTLTNAKVYNNLFINIIDGPVFGSLFTPPVTGNEARNNVFYGVTNPGLGVLFPTYSHNHYVDSSSLSEIGRTTGTGDPFVNYTALDFRLKGPTAAGTTLPPPFDRDMLGKTRGSDGTWDRGAIEFGGATTRPAAPTNLSVR